MSSATQDRPAAPVNRRWLVLVVVAVAQLMVVLDSTVVNISLPSAQRSPGFPNGDRQWVVTAYALPRRDRRLDGRADDRLPGPRPGAPRRVRRRRAAEQSPAAAAARDTRPHPGRLLRRGR